MKHLISVISFSLLLVSCGGGSKLSLDEAKEVTLNYQGDNYTPPPRGVDKLIDEIKNAGDGDVQDDVCGYCDGLDPEHEDITVRLKNISKLGIVAHLKGDSKLAVEYSKRVESLLEHPDIITLSKSGHRIDFDHIYYSALYRLARISYAIGNYSDAIRHIKKSIKSNNNKLKPRKGKLVRDYNFLAIIYASLGNVDEAEDALSEAQDYADTMKGKSKRYEQIKLRKEQRALVTKGVIQNALGNLREAEVLFISAIDSMEDYSLSTKGSTMALRAQVMGGYLVENLLSQGRIAEAEAQSIVGIRYTLENFGYKNFNTAKVLQSYIKVLITRERYDDAEKIIEISKVIFNNLGALPSSIEQVKLEMSLANIRVAKGEWDRAKVIYQNIYKVLKNEPEVRKGLFYNNLNWAVVLANTNQLSEAEKITRSTIEKNSDLFGTKNTNTLMARGILAMIKISSEDKKSAREIFENIVPLVVDAQSSQKTTGIDNQMMRLITESYLSMLSDDYKNGNKEAASRAFYISQLVQGINVKNAVASSAARASIKDSELVNLVKQEQTTKNQIESGYNTIVTNYSQPNSGNRELISATKSRIDQLVKAREAILEEINNKFPEYANLVRPKPVLPEQVQSILNSNESLVLTYSGSKDIYTWTLSKDKSIHFHRKGISRKQLTKKVYDLRRALDLQILSLDEVPVFDVDLAHEFYNNLLRPSAHIWRGSKNIIIVSDGALSSLPFSTFVTEPPKYISHNGKIKFTGYRNVSWLASKYATSYSPSVSTLINLRKLKVQTKPNLQFVGFGNPVFGKPNAKVASASGVIKSRGAIKLNMRGLRKTNKGNIDNKKVTTTKLDMLIALPETADEVLQVAHALKVSQKGNVFLGFEATEKRLKNMTLNNRRVLMFATHALLPGDLDGLVQPAVALSAPSKALGSGQNDGLLTMGEIMGLDLNADWVVLSACNTGAASGKGATAVSGLGQAFFYAGARSLLVSHWPVETTSAKEITTGLFDKQTKDKSLTRAKALNDTIKELIYTKTYKDDSGADLFSYAHPAFWAPFTVVGDGAGRLQ